MYAQEMCPEMRIIMADNMIGEIITDHRERMLNLKKYYPFLIYMINLL